jgi:predicted RNase H-like nuclease (RuvC/YqgF family)
MATRDDAKKIAELETRIADLQRENAALGAVKAEADQQTAELRAQLTAEQSRADSLARDLQSAKAPAPNANSKPNPDSTNDAQVAALSAQLAASRAEVQRLQQLSVRNSQIEGLLESGALQQIELRGVDPGAGHAAARAIYSPTGGLLLVASSLPKLEHEKCYQLWLIRKGAPAILSAGLLETSTDGRGFLYAPPGNQLAQLTGLAITDEPKGGSVSARGHKLLFGAQ